MLRIERQAGRRDVASNVHTALSTSSTIGALVMSDHVHAPPLAPSSRAPSAVPPELDALILACLEKEQGALRAPPRCRRSGLRERSRHASSAARALKAAEVLTRLSDTRRRSAARLAGLILSNRTQASAERDAA